MCNLVHDVFFLNNKMHRTPTLQPCSSFVTTLCCDKSTLYKSQTTSQMWAQYEYEWVRQPAVVVGGKKKSLLKIPLKILDPCHLSDIMISLGFESSALLPLSKTLNECKQLLASEHHWPFSVCCTHPGEHMYEKHGQYVSMYYKKYICAVFSWPNLVKI